MKTFKMASLCFLLAHPISAQDFSAPLFLNNYGGLSVVAQEILDHYRLEYCEQAYEIGGRPVNASEVPIFRVEDGGYRRFSLTRQNQTAEIIYTGKPTFPKWPAT
jgi:hypothetical protein